MPCAKTGNKLYDPNIDLLIQVRITHPEAGLGAREKLPVPGTSLLSLSHIHGSFNIYSVQFIDVTSAMDQGTRSADFDARIGLCWKGNATLSVSLFLSQLSTFRPQDCTDYK